MLFSSLKLPTTTPWPNACRSRVLAASLELKLPATFNFLSPSIWAHTTPCHFDLNDLYCSSNIQTVLKAATQRANWAERCEAGLFFRVGTAWGVGEDGSVAGGKMYLYKTSGLSITYASLLKRSKLLAGIYHLKITILSWFTHSHVIPNQYDFLYSPEQKRQIDGESIHCNYSEWRLKLFGFFYQKAAFKYHNSTKKTCCFKCFGFIWFKVVIA